MLCAVLARGHLKDISYAQEGLQCVPVSHHLWTNTECPVQTWCAENLPYSTKNSREVLLIL